MAEWKKVIVSGSQADLAAVTASIAIKVGSNQQIGTTQANTFLTGSFTGSFSGNGSGLSGLIAAAGTVTSSAQVIAHLPSGTVSGSSQILAGTSIHSGSFFAGIAVVSSSAQITYSGLTGIPSNIVSSSAQLPAGIVSGSSQLPAGIVSGSSQLPAGIVSSSAQLPSGTVSGSSQLPSGIVSGSAQTIAHLPAGTVSGSAQTIAHLPSGTVSGSSPTFVDLTLTGGDLVATTTTTFNLINSGQTTVNFAGAATAINIGAATGTTTINNDTRIKGTLYVDGPVTAISSSNLYVADQFILLASGSVGDTDGGIVIDRGSFAAGNIAFGYDADKDRWGYQSGLGDTTNTIDTAPGASGVSGSFAVYSFTQASHGATKPTTGEFAVLGSQYIDDSGNFWIYTV